MTDEIQPPPITTPVIIPIFFPVSILKLAVMSTVTFGLYDVYWFYKNWKLVKERSGENIVPWARAFFAFFFCYSLFREIKETSNSEGILVSYSAGGLAAVWIVLSLCYKLPDPYYLVDMLSILALLPVQRAVNALNEHSAPGHSPNSQFSAWNIVGIVLGGLLLLLSIVGSFLPD